jgi:tRNA pseudouridine38/39 synthase
LRTFQFEKFARRFVALEVMYVGWRFHGFARQDTTEDTIEVRTARSHITCAQQ